MDVILQCNYEELRALRSGARSWLDSHPRESVAVAAPPPGRPEVEALLPYLEGDLTLPTFAHQRVVEAGLEAVVQLLRVEMELMVVQNHPAHEGAVAAYFDFAHAYAVLSRVREVGREMQALIEVVTGAPVSEEVARGFVFPD